MIRASALAFALPLALARPLRAHSLSTSPKMTSPSPAPASSIGKPDPSRPWRLYVIPSSQFAAKALTALDVRAIDYVTVHVSATSRDSRKKDLPTGGYLVPEVEIPEVGGAYRPVADSSRILGEIDRWPGSEGSMFPSPEVREVEERVSSVVDAYVLYFNHVSRAGFERSMRAKIADYLPLGDVAVRVLPVYLLYKSIRDGFAKRIVETLGEGTKLEDDEMTAGLISELVRYEAVVGNGVGGTGDYLYGYSQPTAADCTLHAMVSRFTDGMGKGMLAASLPDLWTIADGKLHRLEMWQANMTQKYPMNWEESGKGKK